MEQKTSELDRGLGRNATEFDLVTRGLNGEDNDDWWREIRARFRDGAAVKMELGAAIADRVREREKGRLNACMQYLIAAMCFTFT